jgi:hypothetical protein
MLLVSDLGAHDLKACGTCFRVYYQTNFQDLRFCNADVFPTSSIRKAANGNVEVI